MAVMHLQKNGFRELAACGVSVADNVRTWDLRDVTCVLCEKTEQYTDALTYGDIGSPGRERRIEKPRGHGRAQ